MNFKTFIKSFFSFVGKHYKLLIAVFILISAFLISRLPYFLYFPIVGFNPDTAVYFTAIEGLTYGELPKFGVVPPLYPLFLWLVGLFSNNLITVVYVQTIISFISALFFLIVVYKYFPKLSIPFSIGFSVFFMSSHSIVFDSTLLTESIYASILINICTLLIWAIFSNKKFVWILLSICLSLPLFVRPTGFVSIPFIFIICFYFYFTNKKKVLYFNLIFPFVVIILLSSLYTYITLNKIIPGRIMSYIPSKNITKYDLAIKSYQGKTTPYTKEQWRQIVIKENYIFYKNDLQLKKTEKYKVYKNPLMRFLVFLNAISYESRSFYYDEIYKRHRDFYIDNFMEKTYHNNPFNIAPFSISFKQLMFKNYFKKLPNDNFYNDCDIINNSQAKIKNNLFFKIYDFYYKKINLPFFRNKLWIILMSITFIFSLFKLIKSRFQDTVAFIVFFMCCVLYFSAFLMLFTSENTGSWRYVYPTEFIYYISSVFIILFFNLKLILLFFKNLFK